MKLIKNILLIFSVLLPLSVTAQIISVVRENKQQKFHREMPAGNYSGIAYIGDNRYVVVDDKSPNDGYYTFRINIDSLKGTITDVACEGFTETAKGCSDLEAIAYVASTNTIHTIGELNTGIESLTYNEATRSFWTTTEIPLPDDGPTATPENPIENRLRLISYDQQMVKTGEYFYFMDKPQARSKGRIYAFGVSELLALDDGRVVVLEREFRVPRLKLGAWCRCKLYIVDPSNHTNGKLLEKELLTEFKTRLTLTGRRLANFEGMCLGPRLADDSIVILMIADSQYRYKGVLKDWLKTIVIRM